MRHSSELRRLLNEWVEFRIELHPSTDPCSSRVVPTRGLVSGELVYVCTHPQPLKFTFFVLRCTFFDARTRERIEGYRRRYFKTGVLRMRMRISSTFTFTFINLAPLTS
jgi:hypothetical protein